MSQFPAPDDPVNPPLALPYAQGGYGRPKLRPTSVTVLAVLGIIWGSLILLGSLCNTFQLFGVSLNANNPVVKAMNEDAILIAWNVINVIINLVLGVLLLGGSIKALSLKRSGRSWLIAFSWLQILVTVISMGIVVAVVMPRLNQAVQNLSMNPGVNAAMQHGMQIGLWVGLMVNLVALAFPALILYFMSRPSVREAFERGMVAPQWGVASPALEGYTPPPQSGTGAY